jgi:glycosyltransferase involved in cell wall biosynthesis
MTEKELIFFMPHIGFGGVEKNLYLITNFLSKKIKKIKICTLSNDKKKYFNKKIKFISLNKKVNEKLNLRLRFLICLYILFKYLVSNKNVVVFSFQANIYCVLLCKLLNVPIFARSNSSPAGWKHGFIKKFLYKKIMSNSKVIVTNSIYFKKQLLKIVNTRVICIYNPLDKKKIIQKSKEFNKNNFFKNYKEVKILSIGRLTDQKDQITLLKSLKILKKKNFKFRSLIVGSGGEREKLEKYINDNHLTENVKLIGYSSNPFNILRSSDICVLTSKFEGLPNVLLEAATLKKFIISSDCYTGPREILQNGRGGFLFKVGNYQDLAKKIIFYSNNKHKLKKRTNFAHKNLDRFDFEKRLTEYYLILKNYLIVR